MIQEAAQPFQFTAAANLTRVCPQKATTLKELHSLLSQVSDASIFHHTFQSLEAFHYLTEGFVNDFAQWTLAACNENPLAEQLAAVDVRDYVSLSDLRARLVEVLGDYVRENPAACDRCGFEPFYFLETVSVTIPSGATVRTLKEFVAGLESASLSSIHFHFLTSRLRLQLISNDFSLWLRTSLDLPELAEQIERIDIYTNTLEGVRGKIIELAQPWLEH
jgi:hypothetical protein